MKGGRVRQRGERKGWGQYERARGKVELNIGQDRDGPLLVTLARYEVKEREDVPSECESAMKQSSCEVISSSCACEGGTARGRVDEDEDEDGVA